MFGRRAATVVMLGLLVAGRAAAAPPDKPETLSILDLNRASLEELLQFKGIGRRYAEKIIQGRPFRARAELVARQIMPTTVYLSIKHRLFASAPAPAATDDSWPVPEGMLDLNRAGRDQLAAVPGIGQRYADLIVAGRPYRSEFELVGRRLMPLATFNRIQSMVAVGR